MRGIAHAPADVARNMRFGTTKRLRPNSPTAIEGPGRTAAPPPCQPIAAYTADPFVVAVVSQFIRLAVTIANFASVHHPHTALLVQN
jgi:hypothetical protein